MVKASDFIILDCIPEFVRCGVDYAIRSLPYTYDRMGGSFFKRMRRIVAGIAVELAFRRYLGASHIPYDNLGGTPFTAPDHYDIAIGGRRCDIKSFLISQKYKIRQIQQNPGALLQAQALVPVDQTKSGHFSPQDIYIFAFLTALLTPNQDQLKKAITAQQPTFLIKPLPEHWSRPEIWQPLGKLALKTDTSKALEVEIGGLTENRTFAIQKLKLKPRQRAVCNFNFYTINYLHVANIPDGRVGIASSQLDETVLIAPIEWGNIWVYGMKAIFCGYLTVQDFRNRAQFLPVGGRVFQYAKTRTENFAAPIQALEALLPLFERARTWGENQ